MNTGENKLSAILLIHCPDSKGIVAAVSLFINKYNGNITDLHEHVDVENKTFFMRVEWDLSEFELTKDKIDPVFESEVGTEFGMNWKLYFSNETPRAAVFVSKPNHCLFDILSNSYSGNWDIEIPLVISNHRTMEAIVKKFDIEYHHIPITKENKAEQEKEELLLLKKHKIDFIILARYMQILSDEFVSNYPNKIINIHHSFLPAFPGAKPYHSAFKRGVKIIGVTSHYVTSGLDEGPIIEQNVTRISHRDSVKDIIRKGRSLENLVLSKAIWLHINRKTLVHNNRTIIFE